MLAVLLTFTDTSALETGFLVQVVKVDGSIRFETFPPFPGTGTVSLTLPNDGPGDCFSVAAFNSGGVSAFSNRACLPITKPNNPSTLIIK